MLQLKGDLSLTELASESDVSELDVFPSESLRAHTISAFGTPQEAMSYGVIAFCKTSEIAHEFMCAYEMHPEAILLVPIGMPEVKTMASERVLRVVNPKSLYFRLLHQAVIKDKLLPLPPDRRGTFTSTSSAKIEQGVSHGDNLYLGHNTVIGSPGFGFVDLPKSGRLRVPHLGGVVLGACVEIGDNSVVNAGVLEATVIGDNVKIDSSVVVGHGALIGSDSLIVGGAVICGSARIGGRCWIGPNSVVSNGVSIGDDAHIGLGCVITKDVPKGTRWLGNPPRRVM